jgi:hypothetical protein
LTFKELAQQFLELTAEEAAANRTSPKWVDKQQANVTLLREIVGDDTPVVSIGYDVCLRKKRVGAHSGQPDQDLQWAVSR